MVKVVTNVSQGKRKRYNKNKKKAWRKRADISDVEQRLEDERRIERHGGPLSERKDAEMMILDVGDGEAETKHTVEDNEKNVKLNFTLDKIPEGKWTSKKENGQIQLKPRKKMIKPRKAHQFLNGLPGAKIPYKPRNNNKGKLIQAMKVKAKINSKDPKFTGKAKQAVKEMRVSAGTNLKNINRMYRPVDFDIWKNDDAVLKECKNKRIESSFIKSITKDYQNMMKINVNKPKHEPPSTLSALQLPIPGQSYNPSFEAHQDLLRKAMGQEKNKLSRKVRDEWLSQKSGPKPGTSFATEETWLKEMTEGLPKTNDDDDDEEEEEEEDKGKRGKKRKREEDDDDDTDADVTISGRGQFERKTKQQRKKERKQKVQVERAAKRKEERIRLHEFFRIKSIQKEIDTSEQKTEHRRRCRAKFQQSLKDKPKRLGRYQYQPLDIPVALGDELPNSLRQIQPAAGLLEDRFNNFQRRNMIEARRRQQITVKTKKRKVKKQVKRGHLQAMKELDALDLD
ncbi:hypothetical protein Pcinc_010061 [Petrolisthes cinctipes]|uniref:Ribosome biogenesis protein NOP53 n=1 Tax=Petrolisthes cinctipes TaxID=88211 RepID=A0AAE1G3I3_PETCI|nr:hypothetical protein Pcinc_010061 [Petrolisthes cinctipes]